MNVKNKYDLYCWASDFSTKRGEGILARHYIQNLSKIRKKKIYVKSLYGSYYINKGSINKIKLNRKQKIKLNPNLFENYFSPLVGIIFLWINYLKGRGICYLNFLPLWNIVLFIFLPPKTHLGPITGFIYKKKIIGLNTFFRKYLNNFLLKFSLKILFLRQNKTFFSTDLLQPLVKKKNKVFFNYLVNSIEIKKEDKYKKFDFLIYNRNYSVKNNFLRDKFLKIIFKYKLSVVVVGDHMPSKQVTNLGFVSRNKINLLLKKTKFIINSGENPYNIFTIDAYNNHSNIIYEKSFKNKIKFFNKNKIFFINLNKEDNVKDLIKIIDNKPIKSKLTKQYKFFKAQNLSYFDDIKIFFSH